MLRIGWVYSLFTITSISINTLAHAEYISCSLQSYTVINTRFKINSKYAVNIPRNTFQYMPHAFKKLKAITSGVSVFIEVLGIE